MPTFEDLRLVDMISKFSAKIGEINSTRRLGGIKEAGKTLQDVYDFLIVSENDYTSMQESFKNLFSSFNYAAVIINNALKEGGLKGDDGVLLSECFEIMLKCCSVICSELQK